MIPKTNVQSSTKVFVSYSRTDGSFAERLRDRLIEAGFEAYLDKHDIAPGEDWRGRLGGLIESSDTIVFVISPDSVQSKICDWEVNRAELLGKRIIPVVFRETDADAVPDRMKRLNYVFMRTEEEENAGIPELSAALNVDISWIRHHTRYGERAAEWEHSGRSTQLLLRGASIDAAETWRDQRPATAPDLSEVQRAYITASRLTATRRQRWWISGALLTAVATTALAVYAFIQQQAAVERFHSLQSTAIAERVPALLDKKLDLAILLGAEAVNLQPNTQARGSLLTALTHRESLLRFLHVRHNLRSMAFSPRDNILALGDEKGVISLWSIDYGQQLGKSLVGSTGSVWGLAFSPDGTILASLDRDEGHDNLRVWDIERRELVSEPQSVKRNTWNTLAFSPDSTLLALASHDAIHLWAHSEGRFLPGMLSTIDSPVDVIAFTPDGKSLATGSRDGFIRMWDIAERRQKGQDIKAHDHWIASIALSRNGKLMASGDTAGTIRLWNADDLTLQAEESLVASGDKRPDTVRHLVFSSDGKRLVSVGNLVVRQWDTDPSSVELYKVSDWLTEAGPPIVIKDPFPGESALSADGGLIASGGHDGRVALWSTAKMQPLAHPLPGAISEARDIAFSPDGEVLAVASLEGHIHLWDTKTRELIKKPLFTMAKRPVLSIAFSPDGRRLFSGGAGGSINVWDISSSKRASIALPMEHDISGWVRSVAIHPHRKLAASGGDDGIVRMLDFAKGPTAVTKLGAHTYPVQLVAFSPDSRTLVSIGRGDNTIRFWDIDNMRPMGEPLRLPIFFDRVTIGPNRKMLAFSTGKSSITAQLWDITTNRPIGTQMALGDDSVWSLAFSPDGKILATAGDDRKIRIWDVPTGRPIGKPLAGSNKFRALAFSPDGRTLAAADLSGVRLWNFDVKFWRDLACKLANRNLTQEEWVMYFGDEPYHKTCEELPIPKWRTGEILP